MNRYQLLKAFAKNNLNGKCLSVGWILCGNEKVGSSRIHGINLHKGLLDYGVNSFLLKTPEGYVEKLNFSRFDKFLITLSRFDVVIFQRVYDQDAIQFCRDLQKKVTLVGFFMADMYKSDILNEVDFILTASGFLKETLQNEGIPSEKLFVLHDAVETSPSIRKSYSIVNAHHNKKIKLVWVGAEGHWETLKPIHRLLERDVRLSNFELITISNHPKADIRWSLDAVWDDILECDIGIVPTDLSKPEFLAKSNNRVTMFMALAMPVICSPLPSYLEVIRHKENGYIARTDEEWVDSIIELSNIETRKKIGNAAHSFAHENYSLKKVVKDLLSIIKEIKS